MDTNTNGLEGKGHQWKRCWYPIVGVINGSIESLDRLLEGILRNPYL